MAWRRFTTLLRQRTDDINDGARKIVSLGVRGCIGCLFCDWFYEIHGMQPSKERRELIVAARELIKKESCYMAFILIVRVSCNFVAFDKMEKPICSLPACQLTASLLCSRM
ncbi:uncharacterized protein LOC114273726 isoform X1 [Camellia sinensis]|uniref:uncharacterized protein LOC114273726 isoform X1 n=1 Tax=Camellia sinensis TaxID=4442 RepID=UPI00103563A8|nr:uncharacterized protein LOC114273726 isoform X1 [Camellia sinensis]